MKLLLIELIIFLGLHIRLLPLPDGDHGVQRLHFHIGYLVRLVGHTGGHLLRFGNGHADGETDIIGILLYQFPELPFLQKFTVMLILGIILQVHDDLGTDIGLITLCNGVAIRAGGLPLIGGVAAELPGTDRHLIADHERRVEAHAELADHVSVLGVISHLLLELVGTGGGDDAQIVLQILLVHADAVIRNGDGPGVLVDRQVDLEVLPGQLHAVIRQSLIAQLVAGIAGVGENLPEKNLLMGINGVDHQVQQTLGLRLELFLCHEQNTSFVYFNIEYIVARTAKKEITFL